jgi:alpha 1,6-mannosyltransferase
MGSKPISHPDARLVHHALGSWKKFDWLVEYGKFCRTAFGLCRDWTKVVS